MQPDTKHDDHAFTNQGVENQRMDQHSRPVSSSSVHSPPLYQNTFFSHNPTITAARKLYLKMLAGGLLATSLVIFGIFPILYGSFYKTPARNLDGWVVDFDGGDVGQAIITGLSAPNPPSAITWTVVPATDFPGGVSEVSHRISEEESWIAVTVNPGASTRLSSALASPNATYDGRQAVTVYGSEARNENAFRGMLIPSAQVGLTIVSTQFAVQTAKRIANSSTLSQLMSTSPQTVITPISFQIVNLHPFDQPVAAVVVFIALLFVLILSFFIVMIGYVAREKTNLRHLLTYRSLVTLRLTTSITAYFFLALFDCLLALAFQLDVSKKFGHSGFLIFWMLSWCGMCTMGLSFEAMLSLLGFPGMPFFLLIWLMVNVAVCAFPIEVLPVLYRYGYAMPFYCITKASRTIVFGTKNQVGMWFGILISWIAVSCITVTVFGYVSRMRDVKATRRQEETKAGEK